MFSLTPRQLKPCAGLIKKKCYALHSSRALFGRGAKGGALGAGGLILPAKIPAVSRRSLRVRGAGIGSQICRAAP